MLTTTTPPAATRPPTAPDTVLAALIDLRGPARPPHPDRPCDALCVPACTHRPVEDDG
ncbi:MAG TPA: hypothetical protein VD813_12615 [Pseudonocardia sp.]|nr:hypothetical protein [Pseudonocardia sp.]